MPATKLPPNPGPWTDAQWQAICTVGTSILVSAAAGSGKTAVLAERCAYLVCDAPPKARCGVDELLVVTFTNAAAAEMRLRIESALRKKLSQTEDARLARQLALIDRSQISTLHGFCAQVLRQHFHLIGVDPNFTLIPEEEAVLLRNETARELFDEHYASDAAGEFQQLIDRYGDGNDERLIRRVIHTHDLLNSIIDPQSWLDTARKRIDDAAANLGKSELGRELLAHLRDRIKAFRERCIRTAQQLTAMQHFDGYVDVISEYIAAAEAWMMLKGPTPLSKAINDFAAPDLPRLSSGLPNKEIAKKLVDGIRDELKKGSLYELLRFSGADWQESLKRTQAPTKVFLELVDEFAKKYRAAKDELRSMDFSDLERFTLQVLRDRSSKESVAPSATAREYQNRFKYVLVDEYQDINPIQDAILSLVSCDTVKTRGNLFCVGDIKQSIYRFRLAEPQRFAQRYVDFKRNGISHGCAIDLQANFRSRGKLLDSINLCFERLMTAEAGELAYDESQRLREGLKYPGNNGDCFAGAPIEVHLLPKAPRGTPAASSDDPEAVDLDLDRTEREAAFIAQRIRELMGLIEGSKRRTVFDRDSSGILQPRPIEYRDIVILLRAMMVKSDQFAEQLRARGIPVHSDSASGFFDSMEIRDMLALLRLLDNQRQDVPMAAVLRSPLVALPDTDDCLARIRLAYRNERWLPFHQAVVRYAQQHGDELSASLNGFTEQLKHWREMAHRRPLAELLWTIYDQTGYLAFCQGLPDGEQRVANLVSLHERAREFGTFQRQGLSRFMEFLQSLQEQSDLGQPSVASEADNVVRVMSIHRSKGLEFPVVFVPDLGKKHNLSDAAGPILVDRSAYVGLAACDEEKRIRYPSLSWMLAKDKITKQMLAEEMRVLYVAMTRAREHLILVGTCEPTEPQQWLDAWSKFDGAALPADEALRSKCMLSWIGPITAMLQAKHPAAFNVAMHEESELSTWCAESVQKPALTKKQSDLARLAPLQEPPEIDPAAQRILDRLCTPYEHTAFAEIPAVQSVTHLTKTGRAAPAGQSPSRRELVKFDQELPLPLCAMEGSAKITPTEVGSATHLVLQHLDFSLDSTEQSIAEQIRKMTSQRLITSAEAQAVDIEAIEWLMSTELGQFLRDNATQLRREVPIAFAVAPDSHPHARGIDRMMIRGKIDVLIDAKDGLIVIDYKTDRVTAETIDARVEFYHPQVLAYSKAIAGIAQRPIAAAYLVFLAPRAIVPVAE
jgi:ATP-dependent helicase/nuclease subunit A